MVNEIIEINFSDDNKDALFEADNQYWYYRANKVVESRQSRLYKTRQIAGPDGKIHKNYSTNPHIRANYMKYSIVK
jgi:hypothetical protein